MTSQNLRLDTVRAQKHQALMAAQGGLMKAAYERLQNGTTTPANAQLEGRQFYTYEYAGGGGGGGGTGGDWIYINNSATSLSNANRRINNWTIVNTNPTQSYQVTSIQLTWTGPGSRTLQQIYLGNLASPKWSGSGASGGTFNITPNLTIPSGATVGSNQLRFNNSMNSFIVTAVINLSDGSTVSGQIWPAGTPTPPSPGGSSSIIRSTGQLRDLASNIVMRQTALATFEVSSGAMKIKRYNETTGHILP